MADRPAALTATVDIPLTPQEMWSELDLFAAWRTTVRRNVLANIADFIAASAAELDRAGIDAINEVLVPFISGGKCLRSTFMYLGWMCGAAPDEAALRAASSMELLHTFALLQDDVMDDSAHRRGRPAAHVQFAAWHREQGLSGSSRRFGESAAVLLGDLCLIWAEQMLRDCGLAQSRLQRGWSRYDAMRCELAVGQFADLAIDMRDLPALETVLDVARRKSGNYTVRRPLEIGAAIAGCDEATLSVLGRYGAVVGEAFQLRDDLLGVFGAPESTGKPGAGDLLERKPTSVVVTAYRRADATTRSELAEVMRRDNLDDCAIERCRALIVATGAVDQIEAMINARLVEARNTLAGLTLENSVRQALINMAAACTERCS